MKKLNENEIRAAFLPAPLGLQIKILEETSSTNTSAAELARKGCSEATVVMAEKQTEGKGRLDRKWETPPYKNISLSVVLRPLLPPKKVPQFNLVAGLAAYRTFAQLAPSQLRLKWPNDLWIGSKKVGGILTEMEVKNDGQVDYVIVGVGLNINADRNDFSSEIQNIATSLKLETEEEHSRSKIAGLFLREFFSLYKRYQQEGFAPFQYEWENAAQMKGKKVKVEEGSRSFEGICSGINADGYLLVESNGKTETVVAGDVIWNWS